VVEDVYLFNGSINDVRLFPISHTVRVINGSDYFYRYEVRDLTYDGDTVKLNGNLSAGFGKKMIVELHPGYRWAWVYKSGILRAQYDIPSDDYTFNVRLFDPPQRGSLKESKVCDKRGVEIDQPIYGNVSRTRPVYGNCVGVNNVLVCANLTGPNTSCSIDAQIYNHQCVVANESYTQEEQVGTKKVIVYEDYNCKVVGYEFGGRDTGVNVSLWSCNIAKPCMLTCDRRGQSNENGKWESGEEYFEKDFCSDWFDVKGEVAGRKPVEKAKI